MAGLAAKGLSENPVPQALKHGRKETGEGGDGQAFFRGLGPQELGEAGQAFLFNERFSVSWKMREMDVRRVGIAALPLTLVRRQAKCLLDGAFLRGRMKRQRGLWEHTAW